MRSPDSASIYVSSDSSETSDDDPDSDSESSNTDSSPSPKQPLFLENLIKIAQKHVENKADTVTFTKFIASFPIELGKAIKRRSEETLVDSAKKAKRFIKLYLCVECDETFKDKDSLKKHQGTCKKEQEKSPSTAKKAFGCDKCEKSYGYKANLKRHVQSKHEVSAGVVDGQTQSKKYKCALCKDVRADIYKHYGSKHEILFDETKQILFDDGTVLVHSDIDTDKGNAPWFKTQLEKAKDRYKDTTCRLCDVNVKLDTTALLKHHYTVDHRVDANSLSIIQRMFRAEMGAHLVETDAKSNADKKKVIITGQAQNKHITRIIFKCKCGIATESYDASVDHAQDHLVAKYTDKEMAVTRNFSFEADIGDNNVIKVIKYDFETLLTEAWFEMFNDLAADKERILSSSIYRHSRSVKLHSEVTESSTGVPAYRCDMCQLFVYPTKVVNHCINYKTCANNKPKGHYCEECDAHFYSAKALEYHMENHAAGFRLVVFNKKNDVQMNKILGKLQSGDDSHEEDIEEDPKRNADGKRIEIISEVLVTQFCKQCKDYIDASKFEAHNAEHQKENENYSRITSQNNAYSTESVVVNNKSVTREETEQQQAKHVDRMLTEREKIPTNVVNSNENDIVELWDSDSDTCQGHTISVVRADVNMSVSEDMTKDVGNAGSPELALREMLGTNDSQTSMTVDEELPTTQELQQILGKDDSDSENCGEKNNATDNEALPTTQELQQILGEDYSDSENCGEKNNATNNEELPTAQGTVHVVNHGCDNKVKTRMSVKEMINNIISDDDVELENDEFLKLNALISMNLSSRD